MEEYLEETYGITVYQEQVMLLSQKLANFSKGEADVLRKAMGKKQMAVLQKMKPKFLENGASNGHDTEILEKIWKDWEAFAAYAFNKSHSTCYAWIAYQTAYLKANYPAEFMAATLSNNMGNIKDVTKFMEECRRMGIDVLPPDVNESNLKFTVNAEGAIRFGMGAVKGLGHGAVLNIIESRQEAAFKSIFDFATRVDLRACNRKAFEALALSGGFDSLGEVHRAQYFQTNEKDQNFLELVIKYGARMQDQANSSQVSLFGDASEVQIPEPKIPDCPEWGTMETLRREKEVVGIYISGHPLDDYKVAMEFFCNTKCTDLNELRPLIGRECSLGGVITSVDHRVTQQNKGWAIFTVEDYDGVYEFKIFGEDYLKFRMYLIPNAFLFARLRVEKGWVDKKTGKERDPRIVFTQMMQLQDVMDAFAKKITIKLPARSITEEMITKLHEILNAYEGENQITIILTDKEHAINLKMPSRKRKVNINADLLHALDEAGVSYKMN